MSFKPIHLEFTPGKDEGPWVAVARAGYGMDCQVDPLRAAHASVHAWNLGSAAMTYLDVAGQSLSPVDEHHPAWPGEWLFVQAVTSGQVEVEQGQRRERFGPGSLFVLDPARWYRQTFPERAGLVALRLPKAGLRERGTRYTDDRLHVPDLKCANVLAVRDLIQCVARQSDAPSHGLRERFGEHLFDLVDALLAAAAPHARHARSVLLRAQAHIRARLGDASLSPTSIAAAVHVSAKHLQRLFHADGQPLMRYVWQARLERAEHLLRTEGPHRLPVQEIAWRCGFSSAAHFSRAFRQYRGCAPSEVRSAG